MPPASAPPPVGAPIGPPQWDAGPSKAADDGHRIEIDIRNLLLVLGVTCLVAAAVSFLAVNWDRFDASMRAGLLVGTTVASFLACSTARRRGLSGTTTALSWLTTVLLFVDLFAVRRAAFFDTSPDGYAAVGGCVLFGIFLGLAYRNRDAALVTGAILAWLLGAWSACATWNVTGLDVWVLPAAAVVGWLQWRFGVEHRTQGSWERYGLTLMIVAVPAVLTALGDPNALRPVIVIALGTLVLLVGMRFRQLAAVWTGGGTIGVLVAAQLVDVLRGVPGWAVFALVGVVLLGVGAGFEYRMRLATRAGSSESPELGSEEPGEGKASSAWR